MRRHHSNEHGVAMIFCQEADFDESIIEQDLTEFSEFFLAGDQAAISSEHRESNVGASGTQTADDDNTGPAESMYVAKLKEMIDTVLAHEAHLFSPSELELLHRIKTIDCIQQFILARLVQRKRGKWHRADHLASSYTQDLIQYMKIPEAEVPHRMYQALVDLCANWRLGAQPSSGVPDEKEVIDLTLDSDDDDEVIDSQSPKHILVQSTVDAAIVDWTTEPRSFGEDTDSATPDQLLECLSRDELMLMARRLKVPNKPKQNRADFVKAILYSSSTQTTLPFSVTTKPSAATLQKSKNTLKQLFQSKPLKVAGKPKIIPLQERRVRDMCGEIFGGCFRLHDEVFQVLHLVNLVYFRSTQYSEAESILLSAILSTAKKRNYPKYTYLRTPGVFKTRPDLLRYMECLQLLSRIDEILGEGPTGLPKGAKFDRLEAAQEVIALWKGEWDRWNSLVAYIKDKPPCEPGLERFEEGHVLTRVVYKAAHCFGLLKDYNMELKIRSALLRQTRWRRGRRGGWYDRMALIYENHMGRGDANWSQARDILLEGLEDKLVHLGSRPSLVYRLRRIEKRLSIPPEERYVGDGELKTSFERRIEGVRIYTPPQPILPAKRTSTPALTTAKDSKNQAERHSSIASGVADSKAQRPQRKGKTIWIGKEGEVNVETFALEHYATLGFKGVHAEGSVTSTLFGMIFWDILFAPVPGAFETPYQSAPLDLFHDSFTTARQEIIDARLAELIDDEGAARRILETVDARERENATWCVGVRWDLFEREDLLDIADCLGGRALATICRLLAEEYGNRGGGVPDLFLWNPAEKTSKFVEVKGPGDNLSDTQKVWIDTLLSAGVDVEVCRVYELGKIPAPRSTKASKRGKSQARGRSANRGRAAKSRKPTLDDSDHEEPESEDEQDELWSSSDDERTTTDTTGVVRSGNTTTSTTPAQEPIALPLPSESIHSIEPHDTPLHPESSAAPRPISPAPIYTSILGKRDAAEAELDADTNKVANQAPKKARARASGSPTPAQRNVPQSIPSKDPESITRTPRTHTAALRSEPSMPAPVPPSTTPQYKAEPLSPTTPSVINSASKDSLPLTQETAVPETPPPTRQERLMSSSSTKVTITRSSKQWRHAIQVSPVRKKQKENKSGPMSPIMLAAPFTLKREPDDVSTHTDTPARPPPVSASKSMPAPTILPALLAAPTPSRAPISAPATTPANPKSQASNSKERGIALSRTPRTRAATSSERTTLAASPLEWEKKWPDVFPHWVGGVDADSDADYEPSQ